jgi:hypothetical protein
MLSCRSIIQKSGTKAAHARGNRDGERKGAANKIAEKREAENILDIRNV